MDNFVTSIQLVFFLDNADKSRPQRSLSPLLCGVENIHVKLEDVWKGVFGDDTNEQSISRNLTSPPPPENFTPFNIKLPSSYTNSPDIHMEELEDPLDATPKTPHLALSTPIPSPLNEHRSCNDAFCSIHNFTSIDSVQAVHTQEDADVSSARSEGNATNKRFKKRSRRVLKWSDVKRKCLTNLGKSYITKKGKLVDRKVMGNTCCCRNKCGEKITESDRLECFTRFWNLGNKEKQWLFILKYVLKERKKRCLNSSSNRRQYTYKYSLPLKSQSTDLECTRVAICKTLFLNTLAVGERTVKTAFQKFNGVANFEPDNRGRHANHKIVINDVMVKSVCDHVNSFVPVESHFTRQDSSKLYLDGSLTINRMFQLYQEWFNESVYSSQVKTVRQYRDIVNRNFNLGFHTTKKDQCNLCHAYNNTSRHTDADKTAYEEHLKAKNYTKKLKQQDKQDAKDSDGSIVTAVFDFEKVFNCPHGNVNLFYYKLKLSCFNFTIFDVVKKKGICYIWDETVAKMEANEISSCLLNFIDDYVKEGATEFRFWSDNCAGQNINRFFFSFYMYAAKKYNVSIHHRFLEKGHTQNEGDSIHALIERSIKAKTIYSPDEWRLQVHRAKVEGDPYFVKNMTQEQFYDFKTHVNDELLSKNVNKGKMTWDKVREVFVNNLEPNKLYYKYDLEQEPECLVVCNNTRNSRSLPILKHAYSSPLKLSNNKYNDLISLLSANAIPAQYKEYFNNLPHHTAAHGEQIISDEDEDC